MYFSTFTPAISVWGWRVDIKWRQLGGWPRSVQKPSNQFQQPGGGDLPLDQFTRELDVSRAGREWTACDRSSSPAGPRFRSGEERLPCGGLWILPKGMFFTLAAQHAPVTPEVPEKSLALHPTITGSCLASGGKARSDSSRRCARISAIASRKFARHSSCVVPWPFAPGTSAQYATNQGPSLSTIAVNSFRMTVF